MVVIHLVIGNDASDETFVVFQVVGGQERRQIVLVTGRGRFVLRSNSTGVDPFDQRFRDTITVIPNVILNASAGFTNMVRPDETAIFQMDDFRLGVTRRKCTYTSTYEEDDRCSH